MFRKLFAFALTGLASLPLLMGQFQLVGNATSLGNDCYRLTPNLTTQSGAIWNLNQVNLNQSFDLYLQVMLGCNNGGADGMAFVLQRVSTNVGGNGGGLGYVGITPSVAVEFDTYQNSNWGDPAADHMALLSNGSVTHTATTNLAGPVPCLPNSANVEDCQQHDVRVSWNRNTNNFKVWFDCNLRINYTGNIVSNVFNGDSLVFWGFTAGTGALSNLHEVCLDYVSFTQSMVDTTICISDSVQLNAGPGTAYSWLPTTGLSSATIRNPIANPTATTTYIATVTDPCGDQRLDSVTITVDSCPLIANVLVTRTNCFDLELVVTADGGRLPYTYAWSGNNGLTGTTDTARITLPGPGTQNWSVKVTDLNGDTVRISGSELLTNDAFANTGPDTSTCPGLAVRLGTPALPGQTYLWRGITSSIGLPSGSALRQAQVFVSFNNGTAIPQTFCYELTATDSVGCVAKDTVCVTYLPKPNAPFTVNTPVCQGQFSTITYTGAVTPGMTFNWNFDNGVDASGNNSSTAQGPHQVQWLAPNTGPQAVTLQITSGGCASDVTNQLVTVNSAPVSFFTVTTPVCKGSPAVLTYQGTPSATAVPIWTLSGGTIVSGSGFGPLTVNWNSPGIKTISLTVSDGTCVSPTTLDTVVVFDVPVATFSLPPSVCVGDTVQAVYTGNATAAAIYAWNFDGGGVFPALPGQGPAKVAWGTAGTKTVTLQVQENGCFSTAVSANIQVNVKPTAGIASVANQCFPGHSFDFTYTGTTNAQNYFWNFGPSATPTTSNLVNPTGITYASPGTKTVTLQVSANGCLSTPATISFDVIPQPNASFLVNGGGAVCTGDTVYFSPASPPVAGQSYFWNFGNNAVPATSSLPIPGPVLYTSNGVKTISLSVNFRGCQNASATTVTVQDAPLFVAGKDTFYCEGSGPVQLNAITSGGRAPYTFQWTCNRPACGISNPTVEDPLVNPGANAPDTVTYYGQAVDLNGCRSQIDQVRVIIHPKPKVNAGPDTTLCEGAAGATLRGGLDASNRAIGPFAWQWQDTLGNIPPHGMLPPNDKQPIAYVRPTVTTIYLLTVTDISTGCQSNPTTVNPLSTVLVRVQPLPVADAGPDTVMCFGDTITMPGVASGAAPPYLYTWTPTNTGYFSNSNIANPRISPLQTTTYTLVVKAEGCDSRGTQVTVFVETQPTASAGDNKSICQGESVQLNGKASGSPFPSTAYSYHWIPGRGLDDPFSPTPMASPDSTTLYKLIANSNRGCGADTAEVTVNVRPTPLARITTPPLIICKGEKVTLSGTHSFTTAPAPASQIIYRWSPINSIIGTQFGSVITVRPDETTVYTLETSVARDCPTTDRVTVTVVPQPEATITADKPSVCSGESIQLMGGGGLGNSTFLWSPAAGLDDNTIQNPLASPTVTTTYQLIVKEGICSDTTELTLQVFPTPVADYFSSLPRGCVGLEVNFMENTQDATNFIWDFGDGSPVENESNPSHIYTDTGTFTVTLVAIGAGGCESTVSKEKVIVGDGSFAEFTASPDSGVAQVLANAQWTFTDLSAAAYSWVWDFGDGQNSFEQNPVHTYIRAGEYTVTLTVTDENGCVSTVSHGLFLVVEPDLFVPNVFSPNDDGVNDVFEVQYTGKETFRLEIYDRWGKLYFEGDAPDKPWDGFAPGGGPASEGVYFYSLMIGEKGYTGNVTLMR